MTRVKVPWPPALAEFRGQKYAICGSVWLPVPSETTQDDLSNYMDWSTKPKASGALRAPGKSRAQRGTLTMLNALHRASGLVRVLATDGEESASTSKK